VAVSGCVLALALSDMCNMWDVLSHVQHMGATKQHIAAMGPFQGVLMGAAHYAGSKLDTCTR
jgi:hypothetical protein